MRILIAIDGSAYTRRLLDYLAAHADLFSSGHEYTLLTVVPRLPPRAAAVIATETLAAFYLEEAEKVLRPVRAFFTRQGYEARSMHKVGRPGELIARTAKSGKHDLILMGSHGRSALSSLIMGSVAREVLAHCEVPVLLVR